METIKVNLDGMNVPEDWIYATPMQELEAFNTIRSRVPRSDIFAELAHRSCDLAMIAMDMQKLERTDPEDSEFKRAMESLISEKATSILLCMDVLNLDMYNEKYEEMLMAWSELV